MMKQKFKNDAVWCKSAKNLAICFIYEASINLWCDLTTLSLGKEKAFLRALWNFKYREGSLPCLLAMCGPGSHGGDEAGWGLCEGRRELAKSANFTFRHPGLGAKLPQLKGKHTVNTHSVKYEMCALYWPIPLPSCSYLRCPSPATGARALTAARRGWRYWGKNSSGVIIEPLWPSPGRIV